MRGSNSQSSLRAVSKSLVIVLLFSIIAPSPAYTRSVQSSKDQRDETQPTDHGIIEEGSSLKIQRADDENVRKSDDSPEDSVSDGKSSLEAVDGQERGKIEAKKIVESTINSSSTSTKISDEKAKAGEEGIRRFDAVVGNEDFEKIPSDKDDKKLEDRTIVNSEIDATVIKGIIVIDEPLRRDEIQEKLHDVLDESLVTANEHSKRSLDDSQLPKLNVDEARRELDDSVKENDAPEKNVDTAKSRQVPVLIPVALSSSESSHQLSKHFTEPSRESVIVQENMAKRADVEIEKSPDDIVNLEVIENIAKIPELIQAHEARKEENGHNDDGQVDKEGIVSGMKKIIIHEDGLGEVEKIENQENSRKSLSIDGEGDENEEEEEEDGRVVRSDNESKKGEIAPSFEDSSLPNFLKTNASLEDLKAQALSLQKLIKNSTSLQHLREDEILPEIPIFTETEILDALTMFSSLKKSPDQLEYSYLSKMDTSVLNENQLKIVLCTEALIAREQRQTFAENMFECIRGLSILNCMRIFVWPVIADNIPGSFSQNLPTLPIEVNIADWLPGNQRANRPRGSSSRSATSVSSHQRGLVTPELVVTNILSDALSANPSGVDSALPTFIDAKNETLSKLLTPGQLEILRMAETFLPESSRREYSDRMYSCVRRFEYFSCIKYFAWPMVKQHFPALPKFPDYQNWYPSVTLYPGYPILPYPNSEGLGELPEVVEADATRTKSPRPEAMIVDILENTLRQAPRITTFPTAYSNIGISGDSAILTPISADQMAIFYTAEQLIPVPMRQEFIYKTMKCIRDYDYLTCTKYSTWPAVRQLYPGLPEFPDFSSWIPTFAVPELPDFSQYIPDFGSYFPIFPGFPGTQTTQKPATTTTSRPSTANPPYQPQTSTSQPPYQPQPQTTARPPYQPQPVTNQPPYEPQPQPMTNQPPYEPQPQITTNQPPYEPQITTNQPAQPQITTSQPPYEPQITTNQPSQPQTTKRPFYQPQPIPTRPPYQGADSSNLSRDDQRPAESPSTIENRIIQILSNIRWTVIARNLPQIVPIIAENSAVLDALTPNEIKIFGLSKSAIPPQARGDFDARLVGCLQGGSDFLTCARNVIWPTLQLYVRDMPVFPAEETKNVPLSENYASIIPAIYQPIVKSPVAALRRNSGSPDIDARSPNRGQIEAEPEVIQVESVQSIGQHGETVSTKSADFTAPVISITHTRFTPIFSDHPETVLLKILTAIQSSSKLTAENSQPFETYGYLGYLDDYLNQEQKRIIQVSENLLPEAVRTNFMERISGCAKNSNFIVCSRDIVWPTVSQYHPRLPNFPNFHIDDSIEKNVPKTLDSTKKIVPGAISETDIRTGQHGDATVTITDTRFVPIFGEHPEELIMEILKNLQASSPNSHGTEKTAPKTAEFMATFTDQQENIIIVAENLLPESIRRVFNVRMTECTRDNEFLNCARDIAWPTIAQFFPRLPNFPNIESLPALAIENEPAERPTPLLPPQLEPAEIDLAISSKAALAPAENFVAVTAEEEVESRIESALKQISPTTNHLEPKLTHLGNEDSPISSHVTERQASLMKMCEDLLPNSAKPIFVGKMIECTRVDVFSNCIRKIGWPTLRQYVPNVPEFPNFGNFESYFPQVPQEIPQTPQFPDYQLPQVPNFPAFGLSGQNYVYPLRSAQDKISQEAAYHGEGSLINEGEPGVSYHREIQGSTSSVDSSSLPTQPEYSSSLVPESSGRTAELLRRNDSSRESTPKRALTVRRIKRGSIGAEPIDNYQDISTNDIAPPSSNATEFLEFHVDATRPSNEGTKNFEDRLVERSNSTMKNVFGDVNSPDVKAGLASKIFRCVRSLSFARCLGIFVWPLIMENIPSLFGIGNFGALNPFGKFDGTNDFQDISRSSSDEFARELLTRKMKIEEILTNWYRGVTDEKFEANYDFMKIRGYGDGEIGVSFGGFERAGRAARMRDNKNFPSILTIISDIMEDVLDKRETRQESEKKKERKRENHRSERIGKFLVDDRRDVRMENGENNENIESTKDDDKIIATFLDEIGASSASESEEPNLPNDRSSLEDARRAFELLFGTKSSPKFARRLDDFGEESSRLFHGDGAEEKYSGAEKLDERPERRNFSDVFLLRLPRIGEELASREIADFGRKLRIKAAEIMPGLTFVFSFLVQIALAHARAAASVAGMMSNMALGSAMLSMIRQSFFGPMTPPRVKYVYDNMAMGPGILWPQQNHRR